MTLIRKKKKRLDGLKRTVESFRKQLRINFNKEGAVMIEEDYLLLI
jgi:hypothetical protein